jgi:pimeloyl-ACP methyl ester carboxylesterase
VTSAEAGAGLPGVARVSFRCDGTTCAGRLYAPGPGRAPIVVMAPGFAATALMGLPAVAQRFQAAGFGVLLFDYRGFGASDGSPRHVVDLRGQRDDYRAAVTYARGLPWVDPDRVALFGTSLSAGHVLAVAARDHRIAAVIAQAPFTDGPASLRSMPFRSAVKVGLAGLADGVAAALGRSPRYIRVTGAPGSTAVLATADAEPGFTALAAADPSWRNVVAARVALRLPGYRPGRRARSVSCPVLLCVCDRDVLTPAGPTVRSATARTVVRHYPIGHFDIYTAPWSGRAVADQVHFLTEALPGSSPSSSSRPARP